MLTNVEIQGWTHLSPRQKECLEALRTGYCTDKQIARAVGLEVCTVQEYLARARHLLGAHHRVQLALIAERMHESPRRSTSEQEMGRQVGTRTMVASSSVDTLVAPPEGSAHRRPPALYRQLPAHGSARS